MIIVRWCHIRLIGVAFALLFANAGCSSGGGNLLTELKALIPTGATEIGEYQNPPGEFRVSFLKNVDYPNVAISNEAVRLLEGRGWRKCVGANDDWQNYLEVKNGTRFSTHVKQDAYKVDPVVKTIMQWV